MRVLAVLKLSDGKARDKVVPLLGAGVDLTVVRARPVPHAAPRLRQETLAQPSRAPGWRQAWFCLRRGLTVAVRERPTAVVGYYLWPYGLIAWLIARRCGAEPIVSLTGTDFNRDLRRPLLGALLTGVLRRSRAVLVFGDAARRELVARGVPEERAFVLPNTIDTEVFAPRGGPAEFDLVFVGYLRAAKRVDLLLRTLRELRRRRPGARLNVVGDGPERARLEALAAELGVADAVRFSGVRDDVASQLTSARVFVSLTAMEGLPAALLEALCCGLPAVITDVGAVASVVKSGRNGYCLTAPADPAEAARVLGDVLGDESRYRELSREAARTALDHGYAAGAEVWKRVLSPVG